MMENMRFDALLFREDNLVDAFDKGDNIIRIDELTKDEVVTLYLILDKHEINICLFPFIANENEDQPY